MYRKKMNDADWKSFLETARRILGKGASQSWASDSWCAFTTFSSLEHHLTYWAKGLPDEVELLDKQTLDGGLWSQSFQYQDLAHFIIPARFYWEKYDSDSGFESGYKTQDLKSLSEELKMKNIAHRLTDKVLEIKLY